MSFLDKLAKRREEILAEQILDLGVPRWDDPDIHVLYKPLSHEVIRKTFRRVEKAKPAERDRVEVEANADLLVKACTGIYALIDDERYSLRPGDEKGELTTFDEDLAENLGVEDRRAISVCRALFFTDGDMLQHVIQLQRFSGYAEDDTDRQLEGE